MIDLIKYSVVRMIEKFPSIHTLIYNNIDNFKFLFPHEKDFNGLKLIFKKNFDGVFLDVGGNIGLSTIGFRALGFKNNRILIFEPNQKDCKKKLNLIKKKYKNIRIFNFGLSSKNRIFNLYTPVLKGKTFHFLSSSDKNYIKNKLLYHYKSKSKFFILYKSKIVLKKYDSLNLNINPSFVKIDVEGHDHEVIYGMKKTIKKYKPIFLIEYNPENFKKIFKELKNFYNCFIYNIFEKKMNILTRTEIKSLLSGENKKNFFLSNRNIYFVPIKWKF